jgi:hypothetical protein
MASERPETKITRTRRALVSGLMAGLDAPIALFSGELERPLNTRRTTIEGYWKRTGSYIKSAGDTYMLRRTKRG